EMTLRCRVSASVATGFLLAIYESVACAQTFSDGQEHTVNGSTSLVIVQNSSLIPPTTLHVISPANISFLQIHNTSGADMTGGTISGVTMFDASTFSLTGGGVSSVMMLNNGSFSC